ncbi:MAG: hypothetical protein ACYCQJ_01730 [Nitrososphaerales archaeon]
MAVSSPLILYGLAAVNIVLYIVLIEAYLRNRRAFRIPKVSSAKQAFDYFESSYVAIFPQEQDGFTWGDALARARSLSLAGVDWESVENSVRQYEAYRYGGVETQNIDTYPIMKVAMLLRERI